MPPGSKAPLDLGNIGEGAGGPDIPDPNTQKEEKALEGYASRDRELDLQDKTERLEQRKTYAKQTFQLVCVWLSVVLIVVFLQGFGALDLPLIDPFKFQLESAVMVALLATTTANIVAVLLVVMKFLFPSGKE